MMTIQIDDRRVEHLIQQVGREKITNDFLHFIIDRFSTPDTSEASLVEDAAFDPRNFFGVGHSSREEIDRYLSDSRDEWDTPPYAK